MDFTVMGANWWHCLRSMIHLRVRLGYGQVQTWAHATQRPCQMVPNRYAKSIDGHPAIVSPTKILNSARGIGQQSQNFPAGLGRNCGEDTGNDFFDRPSVLFPIPITTIQPFRPSLPSADSQILSEKFGLYTNMYGIPIPRTPSDLPWPGQSFQLVSLYPGKWHC